jgi:hypothetical protein
MMLDCHSCKEKLLVYVNAYGSGQGYFLKGGCPLLNTSVEADDTNEPLRKKVAKAFESWKKDIADVLRHGVEAGEFRADTQVDKVALSIIALVEGAILLGKATRKSAYRNMILDNIRDVIGLIEIKNQ